MKILDSSAFTLDPNILQVSSSTIECKYINIVFIFVNVYVIIRHTHTRKTMTNIDQLLKRSQQLSLQYKLLNFCNQPLICHACHGRSWLSWHRLGAPALQLTLQQARPNGSCPKKVCLPHTVHNAVLLSEELRDLPTLICTVNICKLY